MTSALDTLRKKMLEQKEETVKLKEEVEDLQKQLKAEISRREEVSSFFSCRP